MSTQSQPSTSKPDPIHILIGAIGAFYGSRLHQPNHPQRPVLVSLTCRSNYKHVSSNGLSMKTRSFGDYEFKPYRVYSSVISASKNNSPKWDFVILCTKVLIGDINDSEILLPLFNSTTQSSNPTIVLIQNGVGIETIHRQRFPNVPIISGVTVVNAEQIELGVVRQNRWTRISLGSFLEFEYDDQKIKSKTHQNSELETKSTHQIDLLVELLKQGGIKDAEVYSERDLQLVRWHKLAINASMNPSSILCGGLTNPEMVADPAIRIHLTECMKEVLRAACVIFQLESMPTGFASPEEILESITRAKGEAIKPSMLVDWEQNRPLEIEAILAIPIRIAKRFGVELNRLQSMYAFLNQLQRQRTHGSAKL
ncbi:uncharacterized protein MELLADRAFT_64262 [Melampsora larici-populina 98AG31]|uniref:2-dehydropantoate 2-reductase n=1 Tax=Melampsora larici-populina (strain 98AG31 / pathotype 3-4-7) TaxID=747676 RepID=F4RQT2_MELLP|nr:uncharacterized protein MELLADRAFT_64262 [Melampsora larici-populina 98AG31]EGG05094.1 hypothetical protein MELLADRAFT_64262 [Melampsora larici-populina 98AG31]